MSLARMARWSVALGLMAAVIPAAVKAVPLAPGGGVGLAGTTAAANPWLNGVIIAENIQPFEIKDAGGVVLAKGKLQDRVVRSFMTGTNHFYFRVMLDGPAPVVVTHVMRQSFNGLFTNVDYRLDGIGLAGPRAAFRDPIGQVIRYDFSNNPVLPGTSSRFVFAATNAKTLTKNGQIIILANNGLGKAVLQAYQP